MQSLKEEIKAVISQVCAKEQLELLDLSDETSPLLDMGMDSLDYASVLMALEDKYDFGLQDDDMESMRSIDDIANFLNNKLSLNGGQESVKP
jgi:acyl carrier protein